MTANAWKLGIIGAVALQVLASGGCSSHPEVIRDPDGGWHPGQGGGSTGGGAGHSSADGGLDALPDVLRDGSLDPEAGCAWQEAVPERAGVDIIFIIDNSHSMRDEIEKTTKNIGDFAKKIAGSGLDYQVIMLSAKGTNLTDMREDVANLKGTTCTADYPIEVCVPPPLGVGSGGAQACGDNPPAFHHLDNFPMGIASTNGMWLALGMYNKNYTWADCAQPDANHPTLPPHGGWSRWARMNSTKYFIMITDDDAEYPTLDQDDNHVATGETEPYKIFDKLILNDYDRFGPPGMFGSEKNRKYVYNAICGWTPPNDPEIVQKQDAGHGCRRQYSDPNFNEATTAGVQHQKLAQLTGGIVESICRDDWSSILSKMADHVVSSLGCEYIVPTPEAGVIEPDLVLVQYIPDQGAPQNLTRVTDPSKCGKYENAWYYDDNENPSKVLLCPDTCSTIGASQTGRIDLKFGCKPPPTR